MPRPRKLMADDVIEVMRGHADPFLTLGDIHEQVDVSRGTIHARLEELAADGRIERKDVGASAVVWWLPEQQRQAEV